MILMSLEMSINNFEYKTKATSEQLDVYGHVNHANYLTLFEDSRWAYYKTKGLSQESVKKDQVGPVVLKVNIAYRKEISADEEIVIKFEDQGYRYNLWNLRQLMIKPNGKVACVADYTFGLMDLKERKLITPKDNWMK